MKRTFIFILIIASLLSCSKKEGSSSSSGIEYGIETVDGIILNDELARHPSVSLTITSGSSDLYEVSYFVDDGREEILRNVPMGVPTHLNCAEEEGGHSVSGTITGEEGSCQFSCTYTVRRDDDVRKIYYEPEVTLTTDTIPASGGTISEGEVTYRQKCTITNGEVSRDTMITTGGTVKFGNPVTAESLGSVVTTKPTSVGTLAVTVTMNGKTGTGYCDVYQAINSAVKLEPGAKKTRLTIGETSIVTAYTTYSSGTRKETPNVRYSVSSGSVITLSSTERVITANKCNTDGSLATLSASSGDGLVGSIHVFVEPQCIYLTYSGNSYYSLQNEPYENSWTIYAGLLCEKGGKAIHCNATNNDYLEIEYSSYIITLRNGTTWTWKTGTETVTFTLFNKKISQKIYVN